MTTPPAEPRPAPKRNSWEAAPTWLNVLWWITISAEACGLLMYFTTPAHTPVSSVSIELNTPEHRAALTVGMFIGIATTMWMRFRLRSSNGPAARGAPWGLVAFVLFGWAFGAHSFLMSIITAFTVGPEWLVWNAVQAVGSIVGMAGAYALESRRRVGVTLTALFWAETPITSLVKAITIHFETNAVYVMPVFSAVVAIILLICLFQKEVLEWANG